MHAYITGYTVCYLHIQESKYRIIYDIKTLSLEKIFVVHDGRAQDIGVLLSFFNLVEEVAGVN